MRKWKLWEAYTTCPRSLVSKKRGGGELRAQSQAWSPLGIQWRCQPWEPQAGPSSRPVPIKDRVSTVPRGVAGWHGAAGCMQPWAAATGRCQPSCEHRLRRSPVPRSLLQPAGCSCQHPRGASALQSRRRTREPRGPCRDSGKGSAGQSHGGWTQLTHSPFSDGQPGAQDGWGLPSAIVHHQAGEVGLAW